MDAAGSGGGPEAGEREAVGRLAKLLERALANLTDALAGYAHQGADLLERHRLGTLFETVIEIQDLALARRQVLPEDAVDELAHELRIRAVLDLAPIDSGEALTQGGCLAVRAVDRGIERDLGRRHLLRGANGLRRLLEQPADLVLGGIALQNLGEHRFGARELDQLRVLVERDADGASLLRECLQHGLPDPPHGVGDELDSLVRIELPDRLEESFISNGDELAQVEPVTLILLHIRNDETQIRRHQPLGGQLIALLGASRQAALFFGITDQRELLNVLQVLIESGGGGGTEEPFGPALGRMLHRRPLPVQGEAHLPVRSNSPAGTPR